jgi:hypothetical protein
MAFFRTHLRTCVLALALAACSSSDAPKPPNPYDANFTDCPVDAGSDTTAPGDVSMSDQAYIDHASADDSGDGPTNVIDGEAVDQPNDEPSCALVFGCHGIEGAAHLPICSPTTYGTNPPSSGNHYGIWAAYKTYTKPFPVGFWVHNLEHGAVVLTYNCPAGCANDVARMQAFIDHLPADCGSAPPRRTILVPDPDLDVRFAASSWGFTLKGDCFDEAAFGAFVAAHYGNGPESICSDGVDPLTAGNGGAPLCP